MRNYLIFIFMFVFLGCGKSDEVSPAEEESVSEILPVDDEEWGERDFFEGEIPSNAGLTAVMGEKRVSIKGGELQNLEATNAPRGFGFVTPVGRVFEEGTLDGFIYSGGGLKSSALQLSLFEGHVLLDEDSWFEVAKDENVAWLGQKSVPLSVSQGVNDIRYLKLKGKLHDGFYVVHDDSFIRGRLKSEVHGYYAFVVGEDYLRSRSDRCFYDIFDNLEYVGLRPMADFMFNELMRSCVIYQQLILKDKSLSSTDAEELSDRLLVLDSLRFGVREKNWDVLLMRRDATGSYLQQWFWWLIEESAFKSFNSYFQNRGQASLSLSELSMLYGGVRRRGGSQTLEVIYRVAFRIYHKTGLLESIFKKISAGEHRDKAIFGMMAGYHLKQMELFIKAHPEYSEKFAAIKAKASGEVLEFLKLLGAENRFSGDDIKIGPYDFGVQEVSFETKSSVAQWVVSKSSGLGSCLRSMERRGIKGQGFYILDINDPNSVLGDVSKGYIMIETPFDQQVQLDNNFEECIHERLGEISEQPWWQEIQSFKVALVR